MAEGAPRQFRALDGWRGIGALFVALHHFPGQGFVYHFALVRHSWMFVDFFFVLSGFVVAFAYGERMQKRDALWPFAVRRFFRLWPLHVAVLAGFVALEAYRYWSTGEGFTGTRSLFALLTNLTLTQSLGLNSDMTWNTPAWAVSTEFWTYLVFALTALLFGRWRNVVAILWIAGSVAVLALHSRYGMRETFDWGMARCIYGFFVGALVYELWSRKWLAWFAGTWAETGTVVLALAYLLFIPGDRPLEYLATPVFALVVLAFADDRGVLSRLMARPLSERFGGWSYAIYIVQMFVIASMASMLDLNAITGSKADAMLAVYLVSVLALAIAGWRFIEIPGQQLAKFFLPNRPAR
jgi:peptidoglycan/LPS O-acetylase OafA/YrhL